MPRIAICAPARPLTRETAACVADIAGEFPDLELDFQEQCFVDAGHFAGDDDTRLAAFLKCANDPGIGAVWFARGGYGSNRIAPQAIAGLGEAARGKTYLGYSDMGYLLAGLYKAGIGRPVHGPMPVDIRREGGDEAIRRALGYLSGERTGLEPSLDDNPAVAFNLVTLAMLCGTDLMPDLTGHVVMVEDVSEHLYAIDRLFFHVTQHLRGVTGMRLGRIAEVPDNDVAFGATAEDIACDWCNRAGIPYLGSADIGHDADNKIVPFGVAGRG
jgi:muramoyltetrapeptide carboxypeptidase